MNEESISSTASRTYDNSFRLEQARQTRERILEAAVEAIAGGGQNVTLAEVASRAGVSEPTLYRHFGSRDRLYEALEAHAQRRLAFPPIPERVDAFAGHARRLFERYGEAIELVRTLIRTGLGREIRAHGRTVRTRRLRELLSQHAPELEEAELERTVAVLRVLVSFEAFETLTGELGLTSEEAGRAAEWAVDALLAALPAAASQGGRPGLRPQEARPQGHGAAED